MRGNSINTNPMANTGSDLNSRLRPSFYLTALFISAFLISAPITANCQQPEPDTPNLNQNSEPNQIDNIYTLNTEGKTFLLDLDSGMILSPTESLSGHTNASDILSDAIKNGFDLINGISVSDPAIKPYLGPTALNCSVTPLDNSNWTAQNITISTKKLISTTQYTPLQSENGPATYLITTADLNFFMLQVTTLSPEQTNSRIEYKFLIKDKSSASGFTANTTPTDELVLITANSNSELIDTIDLPGLPGGIPVYNMPGNNNLKTQLSKAMKQSDFNNNIKMPQAKGQWTVRFVDTANDVYIGEPMTDYFWDHWYYYPNHELYERSRDYFYGSGDYKRLEVKYEIKLED
ncbi:MAG: hypothetical protein JW745_03225 [Sedimentisphaerales bacterium]|nr:hypothetical protein [Sedimentisphaerales bacterium]MBN2842533.1 hypothetical protein [Sedimentisphaerales bacterium]